MEMKDMIERLSQLRHLKREVDELSQRIGELEERAMGGSARPMGMLRSGRLDDRVARAAASLADLRDRMARRRLDCLEELGRLYAFIDDLPDSQLRQIFAARYIDGLSWQNVARRIGETDEQVPRRLHNRALRKKIAEMAKFDEKDENNLL
ncbi:MAG TPA: sigma-70 family RNA polymerase sigma factor [Candidatus Faecivicinus avistercoris]|nr:sigma-70 family RNA polymerase sigma factor [Candidatus Faecivicinus avistercoris]